MMIGCKNYISDWDLGDKFHYFVEPLDFHPKVCENIQVCQPEYN